MMNTKTSGILFSALLCLTILSVAFANTELIMSLSIDTDQGGIRDFIVYDGKLYAATSKYAEWGRIYVYDGSNWVLDYTLPGPPIEQNTVWCLAEYDGKLYAGAGSILGDAGVVYVYDPTQSPPGWSIAIDTGEDNVGGLGVYDGKLYVGTSYDGLIYVYDGTSWDITYDASQTIVRSFAEYDGKLYAGTEYFMGAAIYVYDGATDEWQESLGSIDLYGVLSLATYGDKLYAGTSNNGYIYVFDGASWSLAFDSPDTHVWSLATYGGMLFAGTGPNGLIYVFDGTNWELACDMDEFYTWALGGYGGRLFAGMHTGTIYASQLLAVSATIDIDPDTLNLKSNGEFVTCYIELPAVYDVADIDDTTITLTVSGEDFLVNPEAPATIGDYDSDSISDLMVKFDRAPIVDWLGVEDCTFEALVDSSEIEFSVNGALTDGTPFEGYDLVHIISPGK